MQSVPIWCARALLVASRRDALSRRNLRARVGGRVVSSLSNARSDPRALAPRGRDFRGTIAKKAELNDVERVLIRKRR
jgi:hypothetical protein